MPNTATNSIDDFDFIIDSIVPSNPIDDIAIEFNSTTSQPTDATVKTSKNVVESTVNIEAPDLNFNDEVGTKITDNVTSKVDDTVDIDTPESSDASKKDSPNTATSNNVFKIIAEGLAEKNILSETDLKDFDGSEEKFLELFDNRIEQRTSEEITEFANSLNDDGKSFIRHIQAGGTFETFKNFKLSGINESMLDTDDGQKEIIKKYLSKTTKYSEDKINKELERLIKYGELEEVAKENYNDLQEIITSEQTEQEKNVSLQKEEMKKKQTEAINSVRSLINESKEIKGIPLSIDKKDRLELTDYILKPTVKLPNGQVVTQYVKDQMDESEELSKGNYESYLFKAFLLKNKYNTKIFTGNIENKTKLNIMKNLENLDLNNWTSTKTVNSSSVSEKDKSLAIDSWKKAFSDKTPSYIKEQ